MSKSLNESGKKPWYLPPKPQNWPILRSILTPWSLGKPGPSNCTKSTSKRPSWRVGLKEITKHPCGLAATRQFHHSHDGFPWDIGIYAYMNFSWSLWDQWIGKYTVRPMDPSWDFQVDFFLFSILVKIPGSSDLVYKNSAKKNTKKTLPVN